METMHYETASAVGIMKTVLPAGLPVTHIANDHAGTETALFFGGPCNPHVALLFCFPSHIPEEEHHRICHYSMNENGMLSLVIQLPRISQN